MEERKGGNSVNKQARKGEPRESRGKRKLKKRVETKRGEVSIGQFVIKPVSV